MADKFDVFVGNLTFNTTEEQLREKFSFVGPVKNIRILVDKESGKPKGFAFIEYFDANTALSAITHLDQVEVNSRKLKVGYPAQSNLKEIARQNGLVVPESSADGSRAGANNGGAGGDGLSGSAATRMQIEQNVINSLKLHEAWDLLDAMKKLVAEDNNRGNKAKSILESHPQLVNAMYEIQKRLGIALPKGFVQQQEISAAAAPLLSTAVDPSTATQVVVPAPVLMPPPIMPNQWERDERDSWNSDFHSRDWERDSNYNREFNPSWETPQQGWDNRDSRDNWDNRGGFREPMGQQPHQQQPHQQQQHQQQFHGAPAPASMMLNGSAAMLPPPVAPPQFRQPPPMMPSGAAAGVSGVGFPPPVDFFQPPPLAPPTAPPTAPQMPERRSRFN